MRVPIFVSAELRFPQFEDPAGQMPAGFSFFRKAPILRAVGVMPMQTQQPYGTLVSRKYPVGAEIHDSAVSFRVWAPRASQVAVFLEGSRRTFAMERENNGYWSARLEDIPLGARYRFLINGRGPFPDPASRFQPDGPHGPSQVIDPAAYQWRDAGWRGVERIGQVHYEMHIGTFTREGTWRAAMQHLPALAELGITLLELMPVADFPGRFGWGYDGVDLFAPTGLYGRPDDMRAFVDHAHAHGLGVVLDVVYNHVGPGANYLKEFATAYFTSRYRNEWAEAINFDGPDAAPVREFFTTNAAYWVEEFHIDGLRLDATQQIFDASSRHILADIEASVRKAAGERQTCIIAENEPQHTRLLHAREDGGFGLDALWNDDFHHSALAASLGVRDAYYTDYHGTPQELLSALKYGFLFQGQYYTWQKVARGTPALDISRERFVHYIENHDQVANSATGRRLHQLVAPGTWRTLTALLLLGPETPLLFQGQEFASTRPFLYFADHDPELARAVANGRADFLTQFPAIAAMRSELPKPHDLATFEQCKLDHAEREQHAQAVLLHRDVLRLRREDGVIARAYELHVDGAVIGPHAFVIRYFGGSDDRLLIINLAAALNLPSVPEPLVAAPAGQKWQLLWSSEDPAYGGSGVAEIIRGGPWSIPAHSFTVLRSSAT